MGTTTIWMRKYPVSMTEGFLARPHAYDRPCASCFRRVDHRPAVGFVKGIEDEALQLPSRSPVGAGTRHDRFQELGNAGAFACAHLDDFFFARADQIVDLVHDFFGSRRGRSILLMTGKSSSPCSTARYTFDTVWAWMPCAASTTRMAPSHAFRLRETS